MAVTMYDLLVFAKTGYEKPDMTAEDRYKALALFGGGGGKKMVGVPPFSFDAKAGVLSYYGIAGQTSRNLYDASRAIAGHFIRAGNTSADSPLGTIEVNAYYALSDYIAVTEGVTYTVEYIYDNKPGGAGMVFFSDIDGTVISGVPLSKQLDAGGKTYTFTVPDGCKYMRFSHYSKSNVVEYGVMLCEGTAALAYEPFFAGCGDRTANLFNEDYTGIRTGITYVPVYVGSGSVTLSSTAKIAVDAATLFLASGIVSSGITTNVNGVWDGRSKTVQATDGYVTVAFRYVIAEGVRYSPEDADTMLSKGDRPLAYEPYGARIQIDCGGETANVYMAAPLRKIGAVYDFLDSGGTVTRKIEEMVLTGAEKDWAKATSYAGCFYLRNAFGALRTDCVCTHLPYVDVSEFTKGTCTISDSWRLNMWFPQFDNGTTLEEFVAYLAEQYAAGTPVKVQYVLETAKTEQVVAPEVKTVEGTNSLSVVAEVQPSSMTIKYK